MDTIYLLMGIIGFLAFIAAYFFGGFVVLDFLFSHWQLNGWNINSVSIPASGGRRIAYIFFAGVFFLALLVWLYIFWRHSVYLLSLLGQLWNWDVLLFVTLISLHIAANLERVNSQEASSDIEANNKAATALKDASTACITALSILIPASLIVGQVGKSVTDTGVSPAISYALPLIFRADIWFLVSLLSGIFVLIRVAVAGRSKDLTKSFLELVALGLQFIGLFVGMVVMVTALYLVVIPS